MKPITLPLGPLGPGQYHQIFMGAGRGVDERTLAGIAARDKAMGVAGDILHFGPRRAVDAFDRMSKIVTDAGLLCGVSFGVDGHEDDAVHHHDVLTAREKGECMAEVANHPRCSVVGVDAEGGSDRYGLSDDGAINVDVMCARYRELAPHAFTFHQSWWRPQSHRAFPFRRLAIAADFVAPQPYFNNADTVQALGKKRYDILLPQYESSWSTLEATLRATAGCDDPRVETFQAYGWDDIPHVLVRVLLHAPIVIVWGEPKISVTVEAGIRAVRMLRESGLYDPLRLATADTAVLEWQRRYNASHVVKLIEDGAFGPACMLAAGVVVP